MNVCRPSLVRDTVSKHDDGVVVEVVCLRCKRSGTTYHPDQMEPNHAQFPGPQLELYSELKARLPANAQRINSLLASDSEFASNMSSKFVTLETSKLSGWLNVFACLNISPMIVTRDVSKSRGWLNRCASSNISSIFVTRDVSKFSGWLK